MGRVAFYWNALLLVAALVPGVLMVRFLLSYYGIVVGRDNSRDDAWLTFGLQTANMLSVTVGVWLVLTSLSTVPLHRHPLLTRAIAVSTCVLISFDFFSLQWTIAPDHPVRAIIFAAIMPTMIIFGCGVPYAFSVALRNFRNSSTP